MTTIIARNDFHGTECTIEAETYETDYGHVAVLNDSIGKLNKRLCGIKRCECHKFYLTDEEGTIYTLVA